MCFSNLVSLLSFSPQGATKRDNFISSDLLESFAQGAVAIQHAPISPHSPVMLDLKGFHQSAAIYKLRCPKGFVSVKPIGCHKPPPQASWSWSEGCLSNSFGQGYKEWLDNAELDLCALMDLSQDEARNRMGEQWFPVGPRAGLLASEAFDQESSFAHRLHVVWDCISGFARGGSGQVFKQWGARSSCAPAEARIRAEFLQGAL